MTTRQLELTTPHHAGALFLQFGLAFWGATYLLGFSRSGSLEAMAGWLTPVWALVILLSGLTSMVAAGLCASSSRPERNLKAEAYAHVGLFLALFTYGLSFFWVIPQGVLPPKVYYAGITLYWMIAAGKIARCAQLIFEIRKLRKAKQARSTVVHEALADPNQD